MNLSDDPAKSPPIGAPNPVKPVPSDSPTPEATLKIQELLDQIRSLDESMDELRAKKILDIKRAVAEGTYHVSAAEVARKIIDHMQEP